MSRSSFPSGLHLNPEVKAALLQGQPAVALESTIITHGLPFPDNMHLALELEEICRTDGVCPATIAVIDGKPVVGLSELQLQNFAKLGTSALKFSQFDLPYAYALNRTGSTTVAGTMAIAAKAGLKVFATGGIGGVHRDTPFDISHDLKALGSIPMVVVSAGCKAILDIPSTLEVLETEGVLLLGYKTNRFPAFYSIDSGYKVNYEVDDPKDIAAIFKHADQASILVCNPIPKEAEIPMAEIMPVIELALKKAKEQQISGKHVTPFLLSCLSEMTAQRSVIANKALIRNNVKLAAHIAKHMQATATL